MLQFLGEVPHDPGALRRRRVRPPVCGHGARRAGPRPRPCPRGQTEYNPQVIMEAKITEDDGTARDKVTRIQHLSELSMLGQPPHQPKYEVIACIGGRGFSVRREDMRTLLYATRGKVSTLKTLDCLVECSRLKGI